MRTVPHGVGVRDGAKEGCVMGQTCRAEGCREDARGGTHCAYHTRITYEPKAWFCGACDDEVDGWFHKERVQHKIPGVWLCPQCAKFYRGY